MYYYRHLLTQQIRDMFTRKLYKNYDLTLMINVLNFRALVEVIFSDSTHGLQVPLVTERLEYRLCIELLRNIIVE